jgi:hypothetical protein
MFRLVVKQVQSVAVYDFETKLCIVDRHGWTIMEYKYAYTTAMTRYTPQDLGLTAYTPIPVLMLRCIEKMTSPPCLRWYECACDTGNSELGCMIDLYLEMERAKRNAIMLLPQPIAEAIEEYLF